MSTIYVYSQWICLVNSDYVSTYKSSKINKTHYFKMLFWFWYITYAIQIY